MKNKIIAIICVYIIFIFVYIDNNSNIEVLTKMLILFWMLLFFNNSEGKKIFFIFYFLSNSETDRHMSNFLFIIIGLLFPMYSLVSLNIIRINYKYFLKYNGVFLIVILVFFFRDYFGFKTGIANMTYTKFDIFLFILTVVQILFAIYFSKLILLISKRKVSSENYFKNKR
ncbi:hypothetical protein CRU94_08465 [Arcobacter sp. AHV-9/2010]|nr:hypothetical protein CRU94_08465 [Arcobacter sp. CECT 9299]